MSNPSTEENKSDILKEKKIGVVTVEKNQELQTKTCSPLAGEVGAITPAAPFSRWLSPTPAGESGCAQGE